jgi:hypothetical protein
MPHNKTQKKGVSGSRWRRSRSRSRGRSRSRSRSRGRSGEKERRGRKSKSRSRSRERRGRSRERRREELSLITYEPIELTQDWKTYVYISLDFLPLMVKAYKDVKVNGIDEGDQCISNNKEQCVDKCFYVKKETKCVDKRRIQYYIPSPDDGKPAEFMNPSNTIKYQVLFAGPFWETDEEGDSNHNHWKVVSCFDLKQNKQLNFFLVSFSSNQRYNVSRNTGEELKNLVDLILSLSELNYNFCITGHSMGAMMALQFSQLLKNTNNRFFEDRCKVVVFGPYSGYYPMDPEFITCTNVAVFAVVEGNNPDPFLFRQSIDITGEYFPSLIFFDDKQILTKFGGKIGFDNNEKIHELKNYKLRMLSLLQKSGSNFNAIVDDAINTRLGESVIAQYNKHKDKERLEFERISKI